MQNEDDQIQKTTIGNLVDTIQFTKTKKKGSTCETQSISSSHTIEDVKQKSKIWTQEQIQLLSMLLKNYGTDFHILSTFFPKKTKNQIKNKYKQLTNIRKKQERKQQLRFRAMANLFKEVDEKQEQN